MRAKEFYYNNHEASLTKACEYNASHAEEKEAAKSHYASHTEEKKEAAKSHYASHDEEKEAAKSHYASHAEEEAAKIHYASHALEKEAAKVYGSSHVAERQEYFVKYYASHCKKIKESHRDHYAAVANVKNAKLRQKYCINSKQINALRCSIYKRNVRNKKAAARALARVKCINRK